MALADSGSQVNMVTPSFMHQHKFPILLLGDLVDYPLNLIGLGGTRMRPMGFMILQVQVSEITCYDEDVIFLVSGRSRISSGGGGYQAIGGSTLMQVLFGKNVCKNERIGSHWGGHMLAALPGSTNASGG